MKSSNSAALKVTSTVSSSLATEVLPRFGGLAVVLDL